MALQILEQVPLALFTTMRVGGNARFFVRVENIEDLQKAVIFAQERKLPVFVLGAGSNTLFYDEGFSGLVIKIEIKGILYDDAFVTVGAGEMWDNFVRDAGERNLWGVENLSLIPGTVGGATVQNIGAYGVEACDTIYSVEALDAETMQVKTFLRGECEFGYRESIFKKNKNLIVLSSTFKLVFDGTPQIGYEDVKKYFTEKKITKSTLVEIREAIVSIRTAKMPEFSLGTAGSFFKNPIVGAVHYGMLKRKFPEMKAYLQGDGRVKLSAAWLLDKVGNWRAVRHGDAGVHEKQALILVNYGTATANEIISLANEMKKDIKQKTNVDLEEEVVIVK
ncbi:MAG: UDP-N-acetylmuramate dehydrogenase [Candidatus Yonathbacteria bacterium]|nr:UDP-N-acetylmuramate dehydrogenase [Candidatus Yonathbacteria bacterium]